MHALTMATRERERERETERQREREHAREVNAAGRARTHMGCRRYLVRLRERHQTSTRPPCSKRSRRKKTNMKRKKKKKKEKIRLRPSGRTKPRAACITAAAASGS